MEEVEFTARRRRYYAWRLRELGMTFSEIGKLMGVTKARARGLAYDGERQCMHPPKQDANGIVCQVIRDYYRDGKKQRRIRKDTELVRALSRTLSVFIDGPYG